ncbi:hypothetical protein SUGI_0115540 [Cryptomeria japonica]|nr:hypothetical protein SUGI_0115540 [Cryptomeria japonica]
MIPEGWMIPEECPMIRCPAAKNQSHACDIFLTVLLYAVTEVDLKSKEEDVSTPPKRAAQDENGHENAQPHNKWRAVLGDVTNTVLALPVDCSETKVTIRLHTLPSLL